MRVLLYDHDRQRNRSLHHHLENSNIRVTAVHCLKDFLLKFECPTFKLLLIEQTPIQHYNINIETLLNKLGLTFTVIVYTETIAGFDFKIHYLPAYFYFPFTTEKDKKLIRKVKKALQSFKPCKEEHIHDITPDNFNAYYVNKTDVNRVMEYFTEKQKQLITKFLEKKDGISVQEIVQLLNAHSTKNSHNYAQTHIYRLRNKLNRLLGNDYIISYKDHAYQLLCLHK